MKDNEVQEEITTPPENVHDPGNPSDEVDRYLEHMCANNKPFVMFDRTGLRLSFFGLLPITTGDDGEPRIWGGSIILNSAELEYPQVDYKLRITTKKRFNPQLTCSRSKGIIKQNDTFILAYQLPELSIEAVRLTLVVDGNPHEVPLCKYPKADYYWIGKETKVPGPAQLLQERKLSLTAKTDDATMKNVSPGRVENIPEGLKDFVLGGKGLQSIGKLLYPHSSAVFRELSEIKMESFDFSEVFENVNSTDAIAEEIVRRFHDENREKFPTTPALQ